MNEDTNETKNGNGEFKENTNGSNPQVGEVVANSAETNDDQKKYILTKKFEDWVTYYTNPNYYIEVNGEKRKTYGNKTASAIKAYELDYQTQYGSAATIGKENFKKHQYLASKFAEDAGITDDFMVNVLKAKMGEKGTKAWEIMADLTGLRAIVPDTLIQNNTQVNNYASDDPKAIDFNAKFRKFLEQE